MTTQQNGEITRGKKVTKWIKIEEIKDKEGNLIDTKELHNHLSEGWETSDYPSPIQPTYTNQKKWKQQKWKKEHVHLFGNKVRRLRLINE